MRCSILAGCLALSGVGVASAETQVFFTDFDSGAPAAISGYFSIESVAGFAGMGATGGSSVFGGQLLRNDSTGNPAAATALTLTDLPAHTHVSVSFLLAVIDSWDSTNGSVSPDIWRIEIGDEFWFETTFAIASGSVNYSNSAAVIYEGSGNLGWNSFAEKAYDFGLETQLQNIPHTADHLTIRILARGSGWQGGFDESWGIDNLGVSIVNIPAPGAAALLGIAGVVAARRRR
ncbi:MAG: hypothetical protein KIT19_07330 [Phycisphaeraceae bacterium]|nr:hypothetical protein [Phycisphaeraceae bacterium]